MDPKKDVLEEISKELRAFRKETSKGFSDANEKFTAIDKKIASVSKKLSDLNEKVELIWNNMDVDMAMVRKFGRKSTVSNNVSKPSKKK
ncbi:MAG: hypothetical protein ACK500_10750 [Flavobacteriales bacterium]